MPFWNDPDFTGSGPIRVDHGIRASSKRGTIGSTWWSRRFLDVLESFDVGGRLARGRSYARSGQVLSLVVSAGSVTSAVQGSHPDPYEVTVELPVIEPSDWRQVEEAIAGQALFHAKLLAGHVPPELEQVFDGLGLGLFPQPGELSMRCGCPDVSVPCKHLAATVYLLAEAFDRDPFLLLAWRGRTKADLVCGLRQGDDSQSSTVDIQPADPAWSGWADLGCLTGPPLADCVEDYFVNRGRMPVPTSRDAQIVAPDAALRERDPLPLVVNDRLVTDLLREAYLAMGPRPRRSAR